MSGQGQDAAAEEGLIDHLGAWNCVLYGNPELGDERVLLNFAPDGSTRMARTSEDAAHPWVPLSRWRAEGEELTFSDSRTERQFHAELRRPTLGGEWRTVTLFGGWWCSEAEEHVAASILTEPTGEPIAVSVPLLPEVMASPSYPRQAIRDAKEGRAVVCFEVDPEGEIHHPQFIELSDEIFRAPSLDALMRSRYKPRVGSDSVAGRPACRSFVYRLDQVF